MGRSSSSAWLVSQGETIDEVRANIREAIEGWLMAEDEAAGRDSRGSNHRGRGVKQVSGRELRGFFNSAVGFLLESTAAITSSRW